MAAFTTLIGILVSTQAESFETTDGVSKQPVAPGLGETGALSSLDEIGDREHSGDPSALSLDRLKATREKPLFVPSRRPPAEMRPPEPPPPAPIVAPLPPSPPSAALAGIVLGPGEERAIVRMSESDPSLSLRLGDAIEGWTLLRVEPRAAVFGLGDRRATITLPEPDKPATRTRRDP